MREMLSLQPRFEAKRGKRAMKLLDHRRFRAAYDFLVLLSEVGLASVETAQFWTDVQTQSAAERAESFGIGSPRQGEKKRRPRRRRRRSPAQNQ
jgi:poly(A) polymerase